MQIFIDTEFTSFSNPRLISIGAVLADDFTFYGVATDFPVASCTSFVREHVLRGLDHHSPQVRGRFGDIARTFTNWLADHSACHTTCELVADDETDIELARQLVDQSRQQVELRQLRYRMLTAADQQGMELPLQRLFEHAPDRLRHNALDDAIALRTVALQTLRWSSGST